MGEFARVADGTDQEIFGSQPYLDVNKTFKKKRNIYAYRNCTRNGFLIQRIGCLYRIIATMGDIRVHKFI